MSLGDQSDVPWANATHILGYRCVFGLKPNYQFGYKPVCNQANATCVHGRCACRLSYHQVSIDSCVPDEPPNRLFLSFLSWLPLLFPMVLLVGIIYDAMMSYIFTVAETDTFVEADIERARSKTKWEDKQGAVKIMATADELEYDWAYQESETETEDDFSILD